MAQAAQNVESDPATWQINPAEYQYNGSVTAAVIINDVQVGSEDDLLAGFVGDEIRGVANGLLFPCYSELHI